MCTQSWGRPCHHGESEPLRGSRGSTACDVGRPGGELRLVPSPPIGKLETLQYFPPAQAFRPQPLVAMIGLQPAMVRAEVIQRGGDEAPGAANVLFGDFDRVERLTRRAGHGFASPLALLQGSAAGHAHGKPPMPGVSTPAGAVCSLLKAIRTLGRPTILARCATIRA